MSFPVFSSNSFNNVNPARGAVAESVKDSALSGILAGAGAVAGDRVKIDTTVTTPGMVQFVAAADNEAAFGIVKFSVKQDSFSVGDTVEVIFSGGRAVNLVAGGTLTPGTPVAYTAGYLSAVDGTHLQIGLLIDYAVINGVGRVIVGFVAA